jgi:tRNA pseudouridine38-40 synthase
MALAARTRADVDISAPLPVEKIREGLNHFIGDQGASILLVEEVDDTFHARFSATYRRYIYRIINRRAPLVLEANRAWHVTKPLDLTILQEAANALIGRHDFSSFRCVRCQSPDPVRTLDIFRFEQTGELITATIQSRSFLHNQVRAMMGTLRDIGTGSRPVDVIETILAAKDRRAAGQNAPPHGLFLAEVGY